MKIAHRLRRSILKAAIQGKLTEQSLQDGHAKEIVSSVIKEKNKLIKSNQLRKNTIKKISDNLEQIPENWVWSQIGKIIDVRDGTHDTPKYENQGVPLVTSKNLKNGYIDYSSCKLVSIEDADAINKRSYVEDNDILFAMIGTIGNPVLVQKDRDFVIKNVGLFKKISSFNMRYLYYYLLYEQINMKKNRSSGVQSFVSLTYLRCYPIPIPPLSEQKRIVNKLDYILPLIDALEKDENMLAEIVNQFPNKMKASILQAAMQGKLTEQLSNDGFVKVNIFEKANSKVNLIIEDEPFDIPDSWKWLRLGQIVRLSNPQKKEDLILPYLEVRYLRGRKERTLKSSGRFISNGQSIILVDGENSGEVFTVNENGYMGSTFRLLELSDVNVWDYLKYFLKFYKNTLKKNKTGSAIPHLNKKLFLNLLVPIPPLAEQKRIVKKLEELLCLCDEI